MENIIERVLSAFVGAITGGVLGCLIPFALGLLYCLVTLDFTSPESGVFSFFVIITLPIGILVGALKGFVRN